MAYWTMFVPSIVPVSVSFVMMVGAQDALAFGHRPRFFKPGFFIARSAST